MTTKTKLNKWLGHKEPDLWLDPKTYERGEVWRTEWLHLRDWVSADGDVWLKGQIAFGRSSHLTAEEANMKAKAWLSLPHSRKLAEYLGPISIGIDK